MTATWTRESRTWRTSWKAPRTTQANDGKITLGYGPSILVARLFAGFELARRRVPVGRSRGAIAVSVARRPVVTTAAAAISAEKNKFGNMVNMVLDLALGSILKAATSYLTEVDQLRRDGRRSSSASSRKRRSRGREPPGARSRWYARSSSAVAPAGQLAFLAST